MALSDRIRRWRNPAQWQDDHPRVSDGEPLTEEQQDGLFEMQQHESARRRSYRGPSGVALPSELDEEGKPDDV